MNGLPTRRSLLHLITQLLQELPRVREKDRQTKKDGWTKDRDRDSNGYIYTDRQTDRQMHRDRQTDGWTDRNIAGT